MDPLHVSARHQSLHHFVTQAPWEDADLLRVAPPEVLDQMDHHGGVMAWSLDDTGLPKKGVHSVGAARQYSRNLGKEDHCQVAVSLSLVNETLSIPAAYRLYLPEEWDNKPARCREAGAPDGVHFQTKWQIGLDQIGELRREGVPEAPVVAEAGCGTCTEFRKALLERGIPYVVGIQSTATLWPPGKALLPPFPQNPRGGPRPKRLRRDHGHPSQDALCRAKERDQRAWEEGAWREGTKGVLSSRFARVRVRGAHRGSTRRATRPQEWLLIQWPEGEATPTKCWLSTMPSDTSMETLGWLAKVRWRIERDYEELKQGFGLFPFEGRGWRGFHHRATLCIAADAFLAGERACRSPLGIWRSSQHPGCRGGSDPEVLRVRPERHIRSSIGTCRRPLARGWLEDHPGGWCGRFPGIAGCSGHGRTRGHRGLLSSSP